MKTLIILVLVVVLAGGMFLSKPSDASFATFMMAQSQSTSGQSTDSVGKQILGGIIGKAASSVLTYHDHVLWATEDLNSQARYFGMFGHWWKEGSDSAPAKS